MKFEKIQEYLNSLDEEIFRKSASKILTFRTLIYDLIIKNQFKCCLEIGTFKGATTILIAAACDENNSKVITININKEELNIAKDISYKINLNNIQFILGESPTILKSIFENNPIDFVFIDGLHNYSTVIEEAKICENYIDKNKGFILFHDADASGYPEALRSINATIPKEGIYKELVMAYKSFGNVNI